MILPLAILYGPSCLHSRNHSKVCSHELPGHIVNIDVSIDYSHADIFVYLFTQPNLLYILFSVFYNCHTLYLLREYSKRRRQ